MPFGSPLALQLATHKALGMGMAEEQKQQWEISGLAPSRPALTIALAHTLSPTSGSTALTPKPSPP